MKKIKKRLSLFTSIVMLSQAISINTINANITNGSYTILDAQSEATTYQSNDYSNHWAASTIDKLIENSVISGYSDGSIKPDNEISRAEFVTLVNKLFGFTEKADENFADVSSNAWYYEQFAIAKKADCVSGDSNGYANPTANITRAEVCTIIARALELEIIDKTDFSDNNSLPMWAKGFIGAMAQEKLINGYPDGSFGASKNITRAEAFVIINNAYEYINNATQEVTSISVVEEKSSETTTKETKNNVHGSRGGSSRSSNSSSSNSSTTKYYTVNFDCNYEENDINLSGAAVSIPPISVKENNRASKPDDPVIDGYDFIGWFKDSACTIVFSFDEYITSDITLYAKWNIISADTTVPSEVESDTETVVTTEEEITTETTTETSTETTTESTTETSTETSTTIETSTKVTTASTTEIITETTTETTTINVEQYTDIFAPEIDEDHIKEGTIKSEFGDYTAEYIDNEILIMADIDSEISDIVTLAGNYNGEIVGAIPSIREFTVRFDSVSTLEELYEKMDNFKNESIIEDVRLNTLVDIDNAAYYPNDPFGNDEPVFRGKVRSTTDKAWGLEAIKMPDAWGKIKNSIGFDGLNEINVGIIDSLFDYDNSDLNYIDVVNTKNSYTNYARIMYENDLKLQKDNPLYISSNNTSWHGTFVAGIIGARFDNKEGVAGIIPNNNKLKMHGIETYIYNKGENNKPTQSLYDAYLAILIEKRNVKVINRSQAYEITQKDSDSLWEKHMHFTEEECAKKSNDNAEWMTKVMRKYLIDKNKDFLIVQAAGNNEGNDATHFSEFAAITDAAFKKHILVVGSADCVDSEYTIASHSDRGNRIDVLAPGKGIYGIMPKTDELQKMNGTSFAAPYVSGLAALIWSVNPALSSEKVADIIKSTANIEVGDYKMINASAAVEKVLKDMGKYVESTEYDVDGTVLNGISNAPIENVNIEILNDSQTAHIKYLSTDKYGKYKTKLEAGFYTIIFSKLGYASDREYYYVNIENDTTINAVRLNPESIVYGRVVDAENSKPIVNASVEITNTNTKEKYKEYTDDNGKFEIGIDYTSSEIPVLINATINIEDVPGKHTDIYDTLYIDTSKFPEIDLGTFTMDPIPDEEPTPIDPMMFISGNIVDENGSPIYNASIEIYKDNNLLRTIYSNGNGDFKDGLVKGTYSFLISQNGYMNYEIESIDISESCDLGTIQLIQDDGYNLIYTVEDFINMNTDENNRLMNDLNFNNFDYNAANFYGIQYGYTGIFDGNGHTIYNYQGMAAGISGINGLFQGNSGTIKNLNLSAFKLNSFDSSQVIGSLVGSNEGMIENCHVVSGYLTIESPSGGTIGGLVGINSGTIKNCSCKLSITVNAPSYAAYNSTWSGYGQASGICGDNEGSGHIENCMFNGSMYISSTQGASSRAASTAYGITHNNHNSKTINCINAASSITCIVNGGSSSGLSADHILTNGEKIWENTEITLSSVKTTAKDRYGSEFTISSEEIKAIWGDYFS